MRKATVTYVAPLGDSKTVQMDGMTFEDGKSVELNTDEHARLISRLENNQHFDFQMSADDGKDGKDGETVKRRPGRPSKEAKAAYDAADKKLEAAKATKAKAEQEVAATEESIANGSYRTAGKTTDQPADKQPA